LINVNNTALVHELNIDEILEHAIRLCPKFKKEEANPHLSDEHLDSPMNFKGHDENMFNRTPIHDLNFN